MPSHSLAAARMASLLTHVNLQAQWDRNWNQELWALCCVVCLAFSLLLAISKLAKKWLGAGTIGVDPPLTPE